MKKSCRACAREFYTTIESFNRPISAEICPSCLARLEAATDAESLRPLIDAFDQPLLVMQAEPRQVLAANGRAAELFGKTPAQMEAHRGGQVFDCVHSFSQAGCCVDENCQDCRIKAAVVGSLAEGRPAAGVTTTLSIRRGSGDIAHSVTVATERIGTFALMRIDGFAVQH